MLRQLRLLDDPPQGQLASYRVLSRLTGRGSHSRSLRVWTENCLAIAGFCACPGPDSPAAAPTGDGFPKPRVDEIAGAHELEAPDRAILNLLYQHAHDSGRLMRRGMGAAAGGAAPGPVQYLGAMTRRARQPSPAHEGSRQGQLHFRGVPGLRQEQKPGDPR